MRINPKRIRSLGRRAFHDAVETVWRDVSYGIAVIVLTAAVGASIFGLPVDKVTLAGGVACVLAFVLVFVVQCARVLRHPDRHKSWRRTEPRLLTERDHQGPATLYLALEPKEAMYVGRNRVELTDPDGNDWLEYSAADKPQLVRGLSCVYPNSFPDAPPLKSGTYEVRWMLGAKSGGWREILRHSETITLPPTPSLTPAGGAQPSS